MNSAQPLTRSRTSLFLSYRDSAARPTTATPSTPFNRYTREDDDDEYADEEQGLIGLASRRGSTLPGATTSQLPPQWVDAKDHVDTRILAVKPKIAQLDKLHAKHLLPGFKDRSKEEREIEALATSITADFRACQVHIRRIAEQSHALLARRPRDPVDAELKRIDLVLAANVQTALATKVQDLSTAFRKKQTAYLRQLRGNESKAVELQNRASYDPLVALADDEQASRSVLSPSFGTPSLAQQQFFSPSPSTSFSTAAADQRTHEITSIAQSIAELADLFKDLGSLVIDQGTLLDRVDWNVERMGGEVRGAVDELAAATRHQRRSGKCQLLFLLALLVVACCVVLTFRPPRFATGVWAGAAEGTGTGGGGGGGGGGGQGGGLASMEEIAQKLSEELGARDRVAALAPVGGGVLRVRPRSARRRARAAGGEALERRRRRTADQEGAGAG